MAYATFPCFHCLWPSGILTYPSEDFHLAIRDSLLTTLYAFLSFLIAHLQDFVLRNNHYCVVLVSTFISWWSLWSAWQCSSLSGKFDSKHFFRKPIILENLDVKRSTPSYFNLSP